MIEELRTYRATCDNCGKTIDFKSTESEVNYNLKNLMWGYSVRPDGFFREHLNKSHHCPNCIENRNEL